MQSQKQNTTDKNTNGINIQKDAAYLSETDDYWISLRLSRRCAADQIRKI